MGRKTISFVATEELADWLELEAENRMTTVSSAAQQLLVEKYRSAKVEGASSSSAEVEPSDEEILASHSSRWAVPDSDTYEYRVEKPDGDRRYYKTRRGAVDALRRFYG